MENHPSKILYRYRNWEDQNHKSDFENARFYLPLASELNDPFDCCIPHRYDLMPETDLIARGKEMLRESNPEIPDQTADYLTRQRIVELGLRDPGRCPETFEEFSRNYRNCWRVLSFSAINNHPLLWAHYANKHKGICIGISRNFIEEKRRLYQQNTNLVFLPASIDYADYMPIVIPTKSKKDDIEKGETLKILLATKHRIWDYEKEYRYIIASKDGSRKHLENLSFSEIIFGLDMPIEHKLEILEIAKSKYPSAKIYQAHKSMFDYKIEIREYKG